MGHLFVIGDSLAFHGPEQPELLTHPGLFPNVLGELLGLDVDVVARLGWTARDAWWALTRDPHVYSVLLPRADVVVLAVGGMDQLPAWLPTYLRNGLDHVRPGPVRRAVKLAYHHATPYAVRLTRGSLRALPQRATLAYLTRCVEAIRTLKPGTPVVGIVPPPFDAPYFGHVTRTHRPAVLAHRAWGQAQGVPLADLDRVVAPHLAAGTLNSDGMHWSWAAHRDVAEALAAAVAAGPGNAAIRRNVRSP
ncbi:MAG TPA: diglucosylglycerate octanoyltransferase [Mycobacteriales bacterium]|nr:diglucosylglycerate octanoyltransferase [Mycobacteriales bacterium]